MGAAAREERFKRLKSSLHLWEEFWAGAALDGCIAAFPEDSRRSIAEKWRLFFATLEVPCSVLDVATGAGDVLSHAKASRCGAAGLRLVGTDLIQGAPAFPAAMEFRGGIDAAALPFADGSFDYVTSQFGIEYAGFDAALEEAARVAAKGLKMLVHAADGVVVRQNVAQADQARWLLEEAQLGGGLAAHFLAPTPATAAQIDQILRMVTSRAHAEENVMLLEAAYHAALEAQEVWLRQGSDAALEAVSDFEAQLRQHQDRMRLLGAAAVSRAAIAAGAAELRARGFNDAGIAEERSGEQNHLVGYWLQASRPGSRGEMK